MSDQRDLVRMANQIADFFGAYPHEEAVAGVAGHIRDFWTYRMREQLSEYIAAGGEGLKPLAVEAMGRLKAEAA